MINEKIQNNYPLKDLTTFKIGGPAEYFIDTETKDDLVEAVTWAKEKNLPITFLGGASNVLISDYGIKGLVIRVSNKNLLVDNIEIIAGAGVKTWDVAKFSLDNNLIGLEWAIGIPGSLGGAVRGNAGAHGGSFDQVITNVTAFDLEKNQWLNFSKNDTHFNYRHSLFKENPNLIIWEASLNLRAIEDKSEIEKRVEEYKKYRRDLQPHEPSAGCIFKNLFFEDIKKNNSILAQKIEANVRGGKIGAGYLIELAGLKGMVIGQAKISEQHANFIINLGQATAQNVVDLINKIKRDIENKFNISLNKEVQYLGF